jgi:hypothetical protein
MWSAFIVEAGREVNEAAIEGAAIVSLCVQTIDVAGIIRTPTCADSEVALRVVAENFAVSARPIVLRNKIYVTAIEGCGSHPGH